MYRTQVCTISCGFDRNTKRIRHASKNIASNIGVRGKIGCARCQMWLMWSTPVCGLLLNETEGAFGACMRGCRLLSARVKCMMVYTHANDEWREQAQHIHMYKSIEQSARYALQHGSNALLAASLDRRSATTTCESQNARGWHCW